MVAMTFQPRLAKRIPVSRPRLVELPVMKMVPSAMEVLGGNCVCALCSSARGAPPPLARLDSPLDLRQAQVTLSIVEGSLAAAAGAIQPHYWTS